MATGLAAHFTSNCHLVHVQNQKSTHAQLLTQKTRVPPAAMAKHLAVLFGLLAVAALCLLGSNTARAQVLFQVRAVCDRENVFFHHSMHAHALFLVTDHACAAGVQLGVLQEARRLVQVSPGTGGRHRQCRRHARLAAAAIALRLTARCAATCCYPLGRTCSKNERIQQLKLQYLSTN
jgi:hypothetical protein